MTKTQTNSSDNHHKFINNFNNILITITRQITNEAFHTTIWVTNMKFRPMRPRHCYSKTPITMIKHLHRFHLCRYITNDPMVCYYVFLFVNTFVFPKLIAFLSVYDFRILVRFLRVSFEHGSNWTLLSRNYSILEFSKVMEDLVDLRILITEGGGNCGRCFRIAFYVKKSR